MPTFVVGLSIETGKSNGSWKEFSLDASRLYED
jgi:hypothetical protein